MNAYQFWRQEIDENHSGAREWELVSVKAFQLMLDFAERYASERLKAVAANKTEGR
jgi:phage gp46-like protein